MNEKVKDKGIAIAGVLVLIFASVGIFLYNPYNQKEKNINGIEDFFNVVSSFSELPNAIKISDSNPFFALITTPLAIHYSSDGKQEVLPLYIHNNSNPSNAIKRAEDQIGIPADFAIDNSFSAKAVSLSIAERFWKHSDAVLIIQNNQSGYNLGVLSTPIASYLGIPIIITDAIDNQVTSILKKLGVTKSIICGDMGGYGGTLRFKNAEEIVNASIKLVREKFGNVDYITITNPIDIHQPNVLDRTTKEIGPIKMSTVSSMQLVQTIKTLLGSSKNYGQAGSGSTQKTLKIEIDTYTIPKDYKYALVKFEGKNLNPEHVDLFGDSVHFYVEGIPSSSTTSSPSTQDAYGQTIADTFYTENVLYDQGGKTFSISVTPSWTILKEGEIEAKITIEKLSDPLYPMMKGHSSIAPYLTAFHKGIIFGKEEFAFVADDDVLTENGDTCPGLYMSRSNEKLVPLCNQHIFDNIHPPINELLAQLAGISVNNLKELRQHYYDYPVNIAIVGGTAVLPQFTYDAVVGHGGTPSDFIYGNLDPLPGWDNLQNDTFTYYPVQENIVGRITGWDIQDASVLVARTVFYKNIINSLGDWKDSSTIQTGWATDFAKPAILQRIANLLGNTEHVSVGYEEPLRFPTGCTDLSADALKEHSLEPMGFDVLRLSGFESSREGLSKEAINKLKTANLINLFAVSGIRLWNFFGEDNVQGGEGQENSNFIFVHGHGGTDQYNTGNEGLSGIGYGHGPITYLLTKIGLAPMQIFTYLTGIGPSSSISTGIYNVRNVENMNLGPSFIWFETCLVGWIDGKYPKNCMSQAYIHAGAIALVISTTPSSVPGGYVEPYTPYTSFIRIILSYIQARIDAKNGIYPEHHFGEKLYADTLQELKESDSTLGLAFRNAKNRYLPEDANWTMYWTPPLKQTGLFKEYEKENYIKNKYVNFQEFQLYGDPAFDPYEPCNNG